MTMLRIRKEGGIVVDRTLYEAHHAWWYNKAKVRAMQDPTYAEIEARRKTGGNTQIFLSEKHGLDWAEWEAQHEILHRLSPEPILLRIHRWLHNHDIRGYVNQAKWFIQRGKQGWSTYDTWGFDAYMARVIAGGVRQVRDNCHGHPADLTPEKWTEILTEIADGMDAHVRVLEGVLRGRAYEIQKAKTDRAFDLLKVWFGGIWD